MKANVAPTKPGRRPKLRIPSWVPPQVAQRARENYAFALGIQDEQLGKAVTKVMIPLVEDRRMRRVWNELSRRRREDGTFMRPTALSIEAADADDRQGKAMYQLFLRAVKCSLVPGMTMTLRRAEQKRDEFLKKMRSLQIDIEAGIILDAISFAHERNIMTHERRDQLRAASQAYGEIAVETFRADLRVAVERDRGEHRERWFARAIANECQKLFGSPMYGLTAIITSVVHGGREIEPRTVRQWCTPPCG